MHCSVLLQSPKYSGKAVVENKGLNFTLNYLINKKDEINKKGG